MTLLERLAASIEAGKIGQFRNLDSEFGKGNGIHAKRAYNGSLDAAKSLHEAMGFDRWELWRVVDFRGVVAYGCNLPGIDTVYNEIAARAWLLAIVRALIAQESQSEHQ